MQDIKLTRQHFDFIAKVISEITAEDIRATTCLRFADNLQATNPKFNWNAFVKACGCQPHFVEVVKALEPATITLTDFDENVIYSAIQLPSPYQHGDNVPAKEITAADALEAYKKVYGKASNKRARK
jgi:hypothetical protein